MSNVLSMPETNVRMTRFTLNPSTVLSLHNRGLDATVQQVGDPLFQISVMTDRLVQGDRNVWLAFLDDLAGGLNLFTTYDHTQCQPRAYWGAALPGTNWDGTASVSAIGSSGALTLSGLPANYQAKAYDAFGLEQTVASVARYGYFRIMADATANGSGQMQVRVRPFVPDLFTTAAVVRMVKPIGKFLIDPASISFDENDPFAALSFAARQRL